MLERFQLFTIHANYELYQQIHPFLYYLNRKDHKNYDHFYKRYQYRQLYRKREIL